MNDKKVNPRRGTSYTLHEIENSLELRDTAFLKFYHNGVDCVIQTSHLTSEQLLSVPGFAETKWVYQRETHEWIPIFYWDSLQEKDVTDFVDIVDEIDYFNPEKPTKAFWVTPKGFPREQFTQYSVKGV